VHLLSPNTGRSPASTSAIVCLALRTYLACSSGAPPNCTYLIVRWCHRSQQHVYGPALITLLIVLLEVERERFGGTSPSLVVAWRAKSPMNSSNSM
jgi:hypothetical protein